MCTVHISMQFRHTFLKRTKIIEIVAMVITWCMYMEQLSQNLSIYAWCCQIHFILYKQFLFLMMEPIRWKSGTLQLDSKQSTRMTIVSAIWLFGDSITKFNTFHGLESHFPNLMFLWFSRLWEHKHHYEFVITFVLICLHGLLVG